MTDNIVDIASFSETKLNSSLPDAQFQIDNFTMYRSDRTGNGGGGIITYVRSDIPSRRRPDLEKGKAECLVIELLIKSERWCFMTYYNPPKTLNDTFRSNFSHILDKITTSYDKFVVCGYLNYDRLWKYSNPLSDMCTIYGLTNIVKKPTCFKVNKGTLLDVILVDKKSLFFDTSVIINAISVFYALTSTRMRCHVPRMQNKFIEYRSQKHYNKALFLVSVADSNLRSFLTLEDSEHGWRFLKQPLTIMLLSKNARFVQTSRPT